MEAYKTSFRERIGIWWTRKFSPELITKHTNEYIGVYNVGTHKFLSSISPLEWSDEPFGYTEDGINVVKKTKFPTSPLLLVPLKVNVERLRLNAVVKKEITRQWDVDFTDSVLFHPLMCMP